MRKLLSVAATLGALAFALALPASSARNDEGARKPQEGREHQKWVEKSLTEMQTVKVGMTRADLLKVFTEEGGLSTRRQQTYTYRECPYFKVDVEFEPVEDVRSLHKYPGDKIVKLSKPYLDWSHAD